MHIIQIISLTGSFRFRKAEGNEVVGGKGEFEELESVALLLYCTPHQVVQVGQNVFLEGMDTWVV